MVPRDPHFDEHPSPVCEPKRFCGRFRDQAEMRVPVVILLVDAGGPPAFVAWARVALGAALLLPVAIDRAVGVTVGPAASLSG